MTRKGIWSSLVLGVSRGSGIVTRRPPSSSATDATAFSSAPVSASPSALPTRTVNTPASDVTPNLSSAVRRAAAES